MAPWLCVMSDDKWHKLVAAVHISGQQHTHSILLLFTTLATLITQCVGVVKKDPIEESRLISVVYIARLNTCNQSWHNISLPVVDRGICSGLLSFSSLHLLPNLMSSFEPTYASRASLELGFRNAQTQSQTLGLHSEDFDGHVDIAGSRPDQPVKQKVVQFMPFQLSHLFAFATTSSPLSHVATNSVFFFFFKMEQIVCVGLDTFSAIACTYQNQPIQMQLLRKQIAREPLEGQAGHLPSPLPQPSE